jgi:hypothetical protein
MELAARVEHANMPYSQSHTMKLCIESFLDLSVEQDKPEGMEPCLHPDIGQDFYSAVSECMMLLNSVRMDLWYMSARHGAFVVGYSGERDSGVKWEKTSVRPSMSTLLDLLTQEWFVLQLNTSCTNSNF